MTEKAIPEVVITSMSNSALLKLKMALDIAMDKGTFQDVLDVCENIVEGAKNTERPVGVWADSEWRGLDFVYEKFPDSEIKLSDYAPVA
ncbi:hypothetical protein MCEMSEM22_02314 [Comamonadaceae bacterium]